MANPILGLQIGPTVQALRGEHQGRDKVLHKKTSTAKSAKGAMLNACLGIIQRPSGVTTGRDSAVPLGAGGGRAAVSLGRTFEPPLCLVAISMRK